MLASDVSFRARCRLFTALRCRNVVLHHMLHIPEVRVVSGRNMIFCRVRVAFCLRLRRHCTPQIGRKYIKYLKRVEEEYEPLISEFVSEMISHPAFHGMTCAVRSRRFSRLSCTGNISSQRVAKVLEKEPLAIVVNPYK